MHDCAAAMVIHEAGKSRPVTVSELCVTLDKLCTSGVAARRKLLSRLLEAARSSGDLYGVVRLLLPKQDLERCNYQSKEHALGMCLVNALGLSSTSSDAVLLSNWKRTGCSVAGDFSLVALKVLATRHLKLQSSLSVTALNELLDRFAHVSHREAKANVLRDIIKTTTVQEIKWILRMILKDLRCGIGESFVLEMLHPDARAMMQFCMDLKNVCEHLHDHSAHFKRQDVVVGKVLKSQLSKRQDSIDTVWELMSSKSIVAEVKFDGDRMQVHKDGNHISFWSRNGKEHKEYLIPVQDILRQHILSERCVLDGELLVWDSCEQRFKQRTSSLLNRAARAVRKGWESDDQLCCILLLHGVIQNGQPFQQQNNNSATFLVKELSADVGSSDEGIVVKDLNSKWTPGNRDGRWCKIKPDYVSMGADHDLVIIGGYYGSGSRGGHVVSYLLALIDTSQKNGISPRFITLCRCGVGLSEEEHALLQSRISSLFMKNKKGGHPPTTCNYLVTMSRFECPDVWISNPTKSVVLQITSEQRVYRTSTFRAGWTFRFPRVVRARYDKDWSDALSVQEFEGMVTRAKSQGYSLLNGLQIYDSFSKFHGAKKQKKSAYGRPSRVLSHLQICDVSGVPQLSGHMRGLLIFICNTETECDREILQKLIKQCGGKTVMNLLPTVTHIVAAKDRGVHFKVAVSEDRDILKVSWLRACLDQRKILPIRSRDYLFHSSITKEKMLEEMDCFGDTWFENVELRDLYKIGENMSEERLPKLTINAYKWLEARMQVSYIFRGCYLYFQQPTYIRQHDLGAAACATLRRLAIESAMLGASVLETLTNDVTHIIVYAPSEVDASTTLSASLTEYEQGLLKNHLLEVVTHCWLEDCLQAVQRLDVATYSLREFATVPVQLSQDAHRSTSCSKVSEAENICGSQYAIPLPAESLDNYSKVIMKRPAEDASAFSPSKKAKRVASSSAMLMQTKKSRQCKTVKSPTEQLEALPMSFVRKDFMTTPSERAKDYTFLKAQGASQCKRIYGGKDNISASRQGFGNQTLNDSSLQLVKNTAQVDSVSAMLVPKDKHKFDTETIHYKSDAIKDTIEEHVSIWVSGIQSLSESALS
ncbi:hypothetical protein O6H91_10G057100 [Diphasiastrum complanatum]|uniref:Uncharacterized protein n=1 Tax=Diphasiastrum complanatum TaxID=34168 RepID=A0ACC2CH43_DIPCM|nr:hypothetical protein O6H91_10G057100 [Diphasiastrum complanatum]